ncbi:MAG: hypothetical protein R3B84_15335 [Zavarzinella sp.]
MRRIKLVLLVIGMISILVSLPLLGFAVLAGMGILADMSFAENGSIGKQLLQFGLPPLFGGLLLCIPAMLPEKGRRQTEVLDSSTPR